MCPLYLKFLITFLALSAIKAEAGILDWFKSKPTWFPKLEKEPLIEAFYPRGLRISFNDFNGFQIFDFHGKINEKFTNKYDNGTLRFNLLEPKNGRWTYVDKEIALKEGDILYYWYYIKADSEEFWSTRTEKKIKNLAQCPGENLEFPDFHGNLCLCEGPKSEIDAMNNLECNQEQFYIMKKELENAKLQVNVLIETLLLLQKSDRNVPTLILTGKSSTVSDPKQDVKQFLENYLDMNSTDVIYDAHYTDCGILFELKSIIDMENILAAADKKLNDKSERRIYEPERAECQNLQKTEYELLQNIKNNTEGDMGKK